MENNLRVQYIEKYLTQDIRTGPPEDNDKDWINTFPNPFELVGNKEFSICNQAALTEEFIKVKDQTKVIVEIGVSRVTYNQTYDQTSTSIFLRHKRPDTLYLGIDVDDKTFLQGFERNVFTLQSKSENYEVIKAKLDALKITQIDFLFVDGWHSINQVIDELWYVDFMKPGGVIGFHDTNYHPGPSQIIKNLNPEIFEVTQYCEQQDDWGIGFAKIK
jgi:predicted O-methyltransferase YrrM